MALKQRYMDRLDNIDQMETRTMEKRTESKAQTANAISSVSSGFGILQNFSMQQMQP